jgi:PAS domain S-box-containing protein
MSKEVKNIIDINKEAMIIPDGIAVISKEQNIIVFNEAASRITGFGENEIVSKKIKMLFNKSKNDLKYIRESILENRAFTNQPIDITCKSGNVLP